MDSEILIKIIATLILSIAGGYIFYKGLKKVNETEDFLDKTEILKYTLFFIGYTGVIATTLSLAINRLETNNIMVGIIIIISISLLIYPFVYLNALLLEILLVGSINKRMVKKYLAKLFKNRLLRFSFFSMQLMLFISAANMIILNYLN